MKKLLCAWCAFVILFSVTACSWQNDDKVTIYIPENIQSYGEEGKRRDSYKVVFEDGWESKKQFTVQYISTHPNPSTTTLTYKEQFTSMEYDFADDATESYYNEYGLVIRQVTTFAVQEYTKIQNTESTSTYDPQGRVLTVSTITYFTDGTIQKGNRTYTYTDTADGSKGVFTENGVVVEEVLYDRNNHRIGLINYQNDTEVHRMEWTYDAHGNIIRSKTYMKGKQITHTETTYKAVEVSEEFADRFPQFKREK